MGQYGFFDDSKREYVINDPFPPTSWINFLTNKNYNAIISQAGGGAAFYKESSSGRISRYNQSRALPMDRPGFYIYIKEKNGEVFSPTFEPVRTPMDNWKCRHGLGYTVFEGGYKKLDTQVTYFVPTDDNTMLWNVKITNNRGQAAEFSAFSYVEFSFLMAAREPMYWHWNRFFTTTLFNKELNAITYDCHVYEDYPKIKVFLASSMPVASFDCDRNSFVGRAGSLDMPKAIKDGVLAGNELPGGGFPIGALENKFVLKAGESVEFTLALGCDPEWDGAAKLINKYNGNAAVNKALEDVKTHWADFTGVFSCDLPDKDAQRMINIWNPYNCYHSFNRKMSMTSMTTGMEKGGIQSRDSSQDSMSLSSLCPSMAKDRMNSIMQFQKPSGEYFNGFDESSGEPFAMHAVRSDNGVWPVFTVYTYVSETGEYDFLDKQIKYYEGENASLLDHLYQGLVHIGSQRGKNGLPLIVAIDWNDSLYIFQQDGKEESVMLAQQLVYACRLLREIAVFKNRGDIVAFCDKTTEEMTKALNADGVWDGEWYKRYIFSDNQAALGSKDRKEGKIFLNSQSWAVISGTATGGRDVLCMDKAGEILGTPYGLKLLYPAFTGIPQPEDPLYNNGPGIRENGGIFHHANTWAMLAETILGRGDKAFDYYRTILPNVASEERGADKYINEPYALSSTALADPDPRVGEGDMAWFSGTVTWMYLVGTQYILGVLPVLEGLKIDPCVPAKWDGFSVKRKFRGCEYKITVKNPGHVCKGVASISVDGVKIEGNIIAPVDKKQVNVEVIMSAK